MKKQVDVVRTVPGASDLVVRVRRSARARRMALKVAQAGGEVLLTLPRGAREADGLAFAAENAERLREAMASAHPARRVAVGTALAVLGSERRIVVGDRVLLGDDRIEVRDRHPVGPQVAGILKETARAAAAPRIAVHAAALGRQAGRLSLRDTRSRWGSCTARGDLMLSWRLVLAPPEVLDYVIAHEVAHLAHLDHSPAFWRVVSDLCPDFAAHRSWLRAHGAGLMALGFGD